MTYFLNPTGLDRATLRAGGRARLHRHDSGNHSAGPAIAGIAIQSAAFGVPFVFAGILKIAYDRGLYAAFSRHPAEQEMKPPH